MAAVALPALAGDDAVNKFKADWSAAQAAPDKQRPDLLVKALEHLRGAGSVDAAQAAVTVAIDSQIHWKAHDAAAAVLRSMTADAVRAWAMKGLAGDKDARVRVVLCDLVATYPAEIATKALVPALKDKDGVVVSSAAFALSNVKEKDVVSALVQALKDAKDARIQADLSGALEKLTQKTFASAAEWESFWAQSKDAFVFDAAPAADKPEEASGGVPKTTSNGSGLYQTISSNKVVFVIDISYSMRITGEVQEDPKGTAGGGGAPVKRTLSRLEYVQRELSAAIDQQLSKKCLFNVIAYSTKVFPWKTKLVEANEANRKAAKTWVLALKPDSETNTYDALEAAFADKQVDTIYLLTDGFPTDGKFIIMDEIRGEVRKWNATRKVRIHTIAYVVGDGTKFSVLENKGMSKNFMKQLAEESGGTFKCFE
jgi:hypothetical protein